MQSRGQRVHTRHFLIMSLEQVESGLNRSGRVGITVSKRVGSAVTRNRIKRLVREFVRHNKDWLPPGRDVVVIAKRSASAFRCLAAVTEDLSQARGQLS